MDKKGYTYSPFFIIVLMLTAVFMTTYFMKVDNAKAQAIKNEGELTKKQLKLEEDKSALRNALLFASYDAAYEYTQHPSSYSDPEELKSLLETRIGANVRQIDPPLIGAQKVTVDGYEVNERSKKGSPKSWTPKNNGEIHVEITGERFSNGKPTGKTIIEERDIEANVFALQIYHYDLDRRSYKYKFHWKLVEVIASEMQSMLSGVKCYGYSTGISCDNEEYTASQDYNKFCLKRPNGCFESDKDHADCWEDREIKDYMKTAEGTAEMIKSALLNLQRRIANENDISRISGLKQNGITLALGIKKVTVDTKTSCSNQDDHCCRLNEDGQPRDYEKDYGISIRSQGQIEVEEIMISGAALKENDANAGEFEICYTKPVVTSDGTLQPLQMTKTYTLDYKIDIDYRLECQPTYISPGETVHTSTELNDVITFTVNEDSLKFKADTPPCEKGSQPIITVDNSLNIVPQNCGCNCAGRTVSGGSCINSNVVDDPFEGVYDALDEVAKGWGDGIIVF
ncbi:MAG: hypothetical protein JW724_02980 [Candidatus Altiarchaeota archaeon]|nr:hypothetical protein [Candidatus Altiarchaeota archaeon]